MDKQNKKERIDKFDLAVALLNEYDDELVVTQPHHRRPRSLDGSSLPANISHVPPELHRNWHILFGNMNAMQVCYTVNDFPWVEEGGIYIRCCLINGDMCRKRGKHNSTNEQKCRRAWDGLFEGLDFAQSASSMNSTYIDPSYHFYTTRRKMKKK